MRHRRVQGFTCHFALWLSIVLRLCDVACNGTFGVHDAYISRNTDKIGIVHAGSGFLRMRFFIIFEQMFFWCFFTKGCWSQTRVHPKWTNRVLVANNRRDRLEDAEFIVIARVFMYLFNCRVFGRTEAAIITQAILEKKHAQTTVETLHLANGPSTKLPQGLSNSSRTSLAGRAILAICVDYFCMLGWRQYAIIRFANGMLVAQDWYNAEWKCKPH